MRNTWLRSSLIVVGIVLALGVVFSAGIFVGRVSARPFGDRSFRILAPFFSGAHGAVGRIDKIDGGTLALSLRDGTSQIVLVDQATGIEKEHQKVKLSELHVGDEILVIGSPDNQGRIDARWIHVLGLDTVPLRATPAPL